MKCPSCGQENKETAKNCKKCGLDFALPPPWMPDWKWHLKTLAGIYLGLILLFFIIKYLLRQLPPPYNIREIPPEITPWLKSGLKNKTP